MNRLYAEDLRPGQEIPFGTWTLSEADILAYARTWDPLPIHADPDSASSGPFGGIIASGLQTMAVYQRLIVDALWSRAVGKAGRGFEVRFRRPVRPGTTLTGSARVASVTVRPDRGDAVVVLHSELRNPDGAVIVEITADAILDLRPQ